MVNQPASNPAPLTAEDIEENYGKALQIFANTFGMKNCGSIVDAQTQLKKNPLQGIEGTFKGRVIIFLPPRADRYSFPEKPKLWIPEYSNQERQEIMQKFEEGGVDVYLDMG
jgi:hypothetical protein